jgi:nitrate reductase delta subunit
MTTSTGVWDAFAGLLSYPAGHGERVQSEWVPSIVAQFPALALEIAPLLAHTSSAVEGELEELFTRTFDGNAERALELGWHLHGENYARGVLLVRLRKMLRDQALDEGGELPDHVSNVLRLLGRVDAVTARALTGQVLVPALEKVLAGFGEEDNPYRHALVALKRALSEEHVVGSAS